MAQQAILDALRGLKTENPGLGVKRLVVKLREQQPGMEVGTKEVREALSALEAECEATAAAAPPTAHGEEEDEKRCWICLEGEANGPLVQMCACRGTAKWSHKACVDDWRRKSDKEDAAYRCGQCKDRYRDALSLELLSARLQAKRTNDEDTILTLDTLASELQAQGKYDEAEPLYREALEVSRETQGERHPETLTLINSLGSLLQDKGDLAAAEPLYREALEVSYDTLGWSHPDTLLVISNLSMLLRAKGDLAAAEPLCRAVLFVRREFLGNRHPDTLSSINILGALLHTKGKYDEAEPLLREAVEMSRETLGSRHPDTLQNINNLGVLLKIKGDLCVLLEAQGKYDEAEALHREAVEVSRETLGNRHPDTLTFIRNLGEVLEARRATPGQSAS